jgi:small-conductance mechanosensitive channel
MNSLIANVSEATPEAVYTVPFFGAIDFGPYLLSIALFVGTTILFWLIRTIVLVRLRAISERTSTNIDDMLIRAVSSIRTWAYVILSLYLALLPLPLPAFAETAATALVLFTLVWQAIEVITVIIDFFARNVIEKDEDGDGVVDPNAATASSMVTLLSRIVLWAFGGIFVLSNLGIEITSLVAGLGIGGIAVAFALQGILSDLFSSFSIYFDKPFRIGDFIVIGDDMGTVEKIGIKTTRIRTLQGEELVVSNAELTTTRVQNYKKMQERRIVFQFGITYETPREKVKQVAEIVKEIVHNTSDTRLDRVHFASYGDSALVFEVVYFVCSDDYNLYMDRQQEINVALLDTMAKEGIEFAYPTQTVYMKSIGGK